MDGIIKTVIENIDHPNMVFVALAIFVLFKLKNILEFFEYNRSINSKKFDEIIDGTYYSEKEIDYIKELKKREQFRRCTGVDSCEAFRLSMIDMINTSEGKVSHKHFATCEDFLRLENNQIVVRELTTGEKVWRIFVKFTFYVLFIFSLFISFLIFYRITKTQNIPSSYLTALFVSIIEFGIYSHEVLLHKRLEKLREQIT